jgi:hypothetical protein
MLRPLLTSAFVFGLLTPLTAWAETARWINPGGGSFGAAGNWDIGHAPLATDSVVFDLPGTYTVTMDMDRTVSSVTAAAGTVTLDLASRRLTGSVWVDGGTVRVMRGSVIGAGRASGGTLIVENGADFNKGGGAGNGGTIIIRGVVGKGGDGYGAFAVSSGSTARIEGGTIGSRSLTVLGRMEMVGGLINGEVSSFQGVFDMNGGRIQGEHATFSGDSFNSVRGGAVIGAAYGPTVAGMMYVEGAGTVIDVQSVTGEVIVRNGGTFRSYGGGESRVMGQGRLVVSEGGTVQGRFYRTDQGVLRVEPGANPMTGFESFSIYTDTALEAVLDGARTPRFAACGMYGQGPASFDTHLSGALRVEVVHPNGLRIGDRIPIITSASMPLAGSFSSVTLPPLGGGRMLRVVTETNQVVAEVVAGGGQPCWTADFNGDGEFATDADIEAFFACLAGNCCPLCAPSDFNGDGDAATDGDIESFFRVLSGGAC